MTDRYSSPSTFQQTASSKPESGGCLLVLTSPLILVMLSVVILLIFSGNTSIPVDFAISSLSSKPTNNDEHISTLFTPEVRFWESHILAWSDEWGLDPDMVATVMQIESCGDPLAISRSGAMGLFQVMPYHFTDAENPYLPDSNANRGLAYLQLALETYNGSPGFAFAAYNGGITGASRPQSSWPSEMQRYLYWAENIYRDAVLGNSASSYLDEWLANGGYSLCDQAAQRLGIG